MCRRADDRKILKATNTLILLDLPLPDGSYPEVTLSFSQAVCGHISEVTIVGGLY